MAININDINHIVGKNVYTDFENKIKKINTYNKFIQKYDDIQQNWINNQNKKINIKFLYIEFYILILFIISTTYFCFNY